MNIGFFTGFTVSGIFEKFANYQLLFMIGAIGNIIALCLVLKNWHVLKDISTPLSQLEGDIKKRKKRFGIAMVFSMIPIIYILINFANVANGFVLLIGAMVRILKWMARSRKLLNITASSASVRKRMTTRLKGGDLIFTSRGL